MPIYTDKVTRWTKGSPVSADYRCNSRTTKKDNGERDMRAQNPLTFKFDRLLRYKQIPGKQGGVMGFQAASIDRNNRLTSAVYPDNAAYGKFMGKLKYGSGNLGITVAEWRSSSDMVVKRLRGFSRILDHAAKRVVENPKLLRDIRRKGVLAKDVIPVWMEDGTIRRTTKLRKKPTKNQWSKLWNKGTPTSLANDTLEWKFGWSPLIEDMQAFTTTIVQHAIPDTWVRGGHKTPCSTTTGYSSTYEAGWANYMGICRTVWCSNVQISNPNLWLLNRMGFVNPLTVAWDLIPWSFVVGMFANITQVINSLTDTCGLVLTNQSITRTAVISTVERIWTKPVADNAGAVTTSELMYKDKFRIINAPLTPKLQTRIPDLNLELMVTAAALTTQKMRKLNKILGVT